MDRGFQNLLWFLGVVEDNNDPQMLGRVRVRAFGIHPQDLTKVPTEDLPWAYVVSGTYSNNYKPPELNDWVFGFFIDGKGAQQPMLLGTLLGMPTMAPAAYGDSNGGFSAMGDGSSMYGLGRPDMPKLATGEELHTTSVLARNVTGGQPVRTSNGAGWETPKSYYNAEYPYNYAHETKSGHVFELDDTPGHERVNIYHRSGSHIEMNSSGQVSIKSTGSAFVVIDQNGYVRISGDANLTVEGKASILVENDCDLQVDGNLNQKVYGDHTLAVSGRLDVNVGEGIRMRGAKVAIESAIDNVDIISKNNMNLQSGADINLKGAGNFAVTAARVDLNSEDHEAADASPSDLPEPEKRKTVAHKTMVDPFDMGATGDDGVDEPADGAAETDTSQSSGDPELDADRERHGPMLDYIGQKEGTDRGDGYNETLGYGKFTNGDVNLEGMTVGQVKELQRNMLNHPENTFNSSALGRYQITRQTLTDFQGRLGISDSALFDRNTQDRLAIAILKSTNGNPAKLRNRWASFKGVSRNELELKYFGGV
ncbi:baseplate hub [Sinorhizobium phage phiM7]|uniref:Baseplate hub n=2 Tax=Emdodecavirus TaxID=1980937 RepID=S5MAX6_9CAUD|nr:baseplate hub subunit and tail lysozyme [Sinorhizobium phage phiM12]YP_009601223.1 baseplate hub subunit and tail lysozyme [Sinorhizobium phage phiM7]AGR47778.3 baseplate hub [Sinorhizobium phage phiM12]AKF12645.1 baseplate hub [Sinorhizobium phage phiM7]AKF13005.1 baseplate hub [Sinorhizobium phage phiM19]